MFDNPNDIQPTIDDLVGAGIARTDIDQKGCEATYETSETTGGKPLTGFRRWLADFGLASRDSDYMSESVRRGGCVLAVNVDESLVDQDQIIDLLNRHGAVDIDQRGKLYEKEGFKGFDETAPLYTRDETIAERERFAPGGKFAIPVVEENVSVGKRQINRGGIRVVSRVIEQPIERDVRLREEHVDVERRPVDRPLTTDDMSAFKEGEMEFTETAEEPVVSKEARVKEEVVVSKGVEERTEKVHDTARRTDVKVEKTTGARKGPNPNI